MSEEFDAIVIGAGHNGLVAAAELARAGKRVCVVERAEAPGGMARNVEMGEGVMAPQIAHLLYSLDPTLAKALALETKALPTVGLVPGGRHVVMQGGELSYADGSVHPEAASFAALHGRLTRFAALLGQLSEAPPPMLSDGLAAGLSGLREIGGLAKLGLNLKRMGKVEMREFLRILLSNSYDVLLDELTDGPAAGVLAADAVRGAWAGPRSPGSVFSLMYRMGQGGDVRLPMGGMGAVMTALETAATGAGATLSYGSGVASVEAEGDRVVGVTLEDGSVLRGKAVLSSLGATQTMRLAGPQHYDVEAIRRLRNVRSKGTVAKLNLVLKAVPNIPGLTPEQHAARLVVAPSASYVEAAFNPVKYGETSAEPVLEAVIPSLSDPSICEDGRHVMSVVCQFLPYAPKGGWAEAARKSAQNRIFETLGAYMPGLADQVLQAELLTPADIEKLTGAPGGHWHHAEMSIDQLLTVRPVNGLSRYAFGLDGYYLCGASAHPGGDVTGQPGRNAARQVLRDGVLS